LRVFGDRVSLIIYGVTLIVCRHAQILRSYQGLFTERTHDAGLLRICKIWPG
jgi:hypothetical protein